MNAKQIQRWVASELARCDTVAIGVDGGEGHVYANTALATFEMRDGRIWITSWCSGLEWHKFEAPAKERDFELPDYGYPWVTGSHRRVK